MSIGIVTDSSCDLPSATLLKMGIAAVPLSIFVGNEFYLDWQTLEPSTLYQWMADEDVQPEINPPTIERFQQVYERYLRNYEHIISLHVSSKLSQTLFYAEEAIDALNARDRIHIVDTQVTSATLANIVLAVAEEVSRGATLDEALWLANFIRNQSLTLYSPTTLKWLNASNFVDISGTPLRGLLNLRPLLSLFEGDIVFDSMVRSGKIYQQLAENLSQRFGLSPFHLTLALAGNHRGEIEKLKRAMERAQLTIKSGRVQMIGATIGTHLGPGTLGIAAYAEPGPLLDI